MSLKDAVKAVEQSTARPLCKLGDILSKLDADDVAAFETMVSEKRTYVHMAKVFRHAEIPVSDKTIGMHMRGECTCR